MKIENCLNGDVKEILALYENARSLQTHHKMVVWPMFKAAFIENEIVEQRQWKLKVENEIACNWAITFEDKEIWEEKDQNDAIYIHRICNNPKFRGNRYIDEIVNWAKIYAKSLNKQYVRLDTLGNNTNLIKHYTSAGFDFLGIFKLGNTDNLPKHYQDEPDCCLFQIDLKD
jgi:ribosomal protein S18 acetylase RimI-like enzyme